MFSWETSETFSKCLFVRLPDEVSKLVSVLSQNLEHHKSIPMTNPKAYQRLYQTSVIKFFAKIVNSFWSCNIFSKKLHHKSMNMIFNA